MSEATSIIPRRRGPPPCRPAKLPKALLNFFYQDYSSWLLTYLGPNPSSSRLQALKMTTRFQMEAMRNAGVLVFILTLPTAKEDDKFVRDWAVANGAGMGSKESGCSTYEVLRGPMMYIRYAIRDTVRLGMEQQREGEDGEEGGEDAEMVRAKDDGFVMQCWESLDAKLRERYDI